MPAEHEDAVTSRVGAIHQSALESVLDGCSWQYYLGNVLRLPQDRKVHSVVGTIVHSAIELYENRRMIGDSLGELDDYLAFIWEAVAAVFPEIPAHLRTLKGTELDLDAVAAMGTIAFSNWWAYPNKDGGLSHREWLADYDPLGIEVYFKVPLIDGLDPIGGWVDGVYKHRATGRIVILDEKTTGDIPKWDPEKKRDQATMYAVGLLLSDMFPEVQSLDDIDFWFLVSRTNGTSRAEGAKRFKLNVSLSDVARLGYRIRELDTIVKRNLWAPNPAWNLCSETYCPFWADCPKETITTGGTA